MFRKTEDDRRTVTVRLDGQVVTAYEHETVADLLLRQDPAWAGRNPAIGATRAPYCMMGVCFDCMVEVAGAGRVQSCLTPVREGMGVTRLQDRPEVKS